MTRLGNSVPEFVSSVQAELFPLLTRRAYTHLDANSVTTGKDYLHKIWRLLISVPIGIAIIYRKMPLKTVGNIYYEIGMMQALGKETLIIIQPGCVQPSDFVRTEYVRFDDAFEVKMDQFMDSLQELVDTYYVPLAESLEHDPLLSIDYYRRAWLLTGDELYKSRARDVLQAAGLGARARNSVEMLLSDFCR